MITYGLTDPLNQLDSLHVLLDIVESIILESKANSGEDDAVERAIFELYRPEEGEKPNGFDEDDIEDSFTQFEKAMGSDDT